MRKPWRRPRNSPNWALLERFVVPHYDDPTGNPYLIRWRIVSTPLFGIMLHRLGTPDPRQVLHNHPWAFVSVVLKGGYTEMVPGSMWNDRDDSLSYAVSKQVKRINIKRFENSFHWIASLDQTPTWTLMFVGRRKRIWGYLEENGKFTPYNEHPFNDDYLAALAAQGDAA